MHKTVKDASAAALEAGILRHLRAQNVFVPKVMECRDSRLVLEYLPGEPLPELLERGDYNPEALARALCDWFAAFYAAIPPGELRGDVNGRNFLYNGARIASVDFEERCYGHPAEDAGRLAAFIESYDTKYPEMQAALSRAFMRRFDESLSCGMEGILREREREYAAMRLRRQKK
ncbi:MAG: hypothetical protein FWH26_08830 [Oscillospiraceae bacterium]|nr:hypothetical protein [Oscillospiraceae bacterium]